MQLPVRPTALSKNVDYEPRKTLKNLRRIIIFLKDYELLKTGHVALNDSNDIFRHIHQITDSAVVQVDRWAPVNITFYANHNDVFHVFRLWND